MMRLLLLAAVLFACLTWPCSAETDPNTTTEKEEKDAEFKEWVKKMNRSTMGFYVPKPHPTVFFASDVPETLELVEIARKQLKVAKSAANLVNSSNATEDVINSRARAETAVKALSATTSDASTFAKVAAKVAQELYDSDTAVALLTEEHKKWFDERFGKATTQEPKMTAAVAKMLNVSRGFPGMHPLITAVLTPAKSIYTLLQNALNDAKYIASKRVSTAMLAERIESLHELAKEKYQQTPETTCTDKKENNGDATAVSGHRDTAAKAYLSAASAQKIAVSCVARIKGNATQVDTTYYELRQLLAKIRVKDYAEMHVYQTIGAEAHADAEESELVATGTPDYAEGFVKTAKTHLDSITSCTNAKEAEWHANEAQKASQRAADEMHYALYRLFHVGVSLQQVADAKKAVEESEAMKEALKEETEDSKLSKETSTTPKTIPTEKSEVQTENGEEGKRRMMPREKTAEEKAEERAAVRDAKKKAVESEKEAEQSYDAVKAHANMAANTVLHITDIVNQMKQLAAQVPRGKEEDKTKKMDAELAKAQTALQTANESSIKVQAAAAVVYGNYNKTKSAVNSALHWYEKSIVEHWLKNATEMAKSTKDSATTEETKAKTALDEVEEQKVVALTAYSDLSKLVEELRKQNGLNAMKLKTERASERNGDRDSATASSSLLYVPVTVLGVMAVSLLGPL